MIESNATPGRPVPFSPGFHPDERKDPLGLQADAAAGTAGAAAETGNDDDAGTAQSRYDPDDTEGPR